ncbi:MAG: hypothetical protein HRU27_06820 [Rhizobiaceae bacterium]|nr:hypothetical protein [Rhizobiaceae bacterium]
MNDFKPWYASRTIWGSIIALLAAVASAFGVEIDQQMQTTFIESVLQLVAIGGSILAVFGRMTATTQID